MTTTAQASPTLRRLARLGLVSRGVTYVLLAWLVLAIAIGRQQHQASDKGAFQTLAGHSWGKVVLVVLAVGFAGYAVLSAVRALTEKSGDDGAKSAAKRLGALGQAVVYGFLCYLAIALVIGAGSSGGSGSPAPLAAKAMTSSAGRAAVVVAGVVVIVAGIVLVVRGLQRKFEDDLSMGELPETTQRAVVIIGTVGSVARGLVVALVGLFLTLAGILHKATEAKGLDASLVSVGNHPFGKVALVAVAVGIACFGVFSIVAARYTTP